MSTQTPAKAPGFAAPTLRSSAQRTATLPLPADISAITPAVARHGSKRPTAAFIAAYTPLEKQDIREIMLDAIYMAAHDVQGEAYDALLREDYPELYNMLNRPQWTMNTVEEAFGNIGASDVAPLRALWLRHSRSMPKALQRISPRAAVHATQMSQAAFHRLAAKVSPFPIQEYGQFQRTLSLQTYRSPVTTTLCTSVMMNPTKVSAGARRSAITDYALRLPKMRGEQELNQHDLAPIFTRLLYRPSYGDDLNKLLVSLATNAAQWIAKQFDHIDPEALGTRPTVMHRIEEIMLIIGGRSGDVWSDDEMADNYVPPNPASPSNRAWPKDARDVLVDAMSHFISKPWDRTIRVTGMPGLSMVDRASQMLAYAMMREQVRRRNSRLLSSLKATTLLAVSRMTGIPPGVFLNYFTDHYHRTGILLFSEGEAQSLLELVEDEPARGGNQALGRAEMIGEIEEWMTDCARMGVRPERIDMLLQSGATPEWGLGIDDDEDE